MQLVDVREKIPLVTIVIVVVAVVAEFSSPCLP